MGRRRKEEQTVFRLESYEIAKIRQDEMLRNAERSRLARINRRERGTNDLRTVLHLLTLRQLTIIRQG
jgi:hypothetical protein